MFSVGRIKTSKFIKNTRDNFIIFFLSPASYALTYAYSTIHFQADINCCETAPLKKPTKIGLSSTEW
jgi:hypothetical protein